MKLRYTGTKPLPFRLELPVPLLRKSDKIGEAVFNPVGELRDDWAVWVLSHGMPFKPVDLAKEERAAKRRYTHHQARLRRAKQFDGRRFMGTMGRWSAKNFLKEKKLTEYMTLERQPYGGWVIRAIAAVSAGPQSPVTAIAEGQGESNDRATGQEG